MKSQLAFDLLRSDEDLRVFLKLNATSIRLLSKILHQGPQTQGRKLQIQNRLCQLKSLNIKAKHRRSQHLRQQHHHHRIAGSGLSEKENRSDRIQWIEIGNAFKSRIRTGAIVNFAHKFAEDFLLDAFFLLKRRITNALQKRCSLKVNVELSAKYELSRTGEIDDKFFSTANIWITQSTDLDGVMSQFLESILTKVSNV